ncbi:hypothetical protein [Salinimicrobium flavum]|uniref:Fibronectin type-III domain-containing protein n=1 Tax=Salinimicrobium flavum TaxID=1737065 RepID=A0ABW5IVX9_9FLAO
MKNLKIILGVLFLIAFIGCDKDDDNIIEEEAKLPGDVLLIAPLKNQTCEEGLDVSDELSKITFEWNDSENTETYDLIITDPESGNEVVSFLNLTSPTRKVDLVKDKSYTWEVISKNSEATETGASESWNFYLVGDPQSNYAPFPAEILKPEQSASVELSDGKAVLEWQGADPDGNELIYTVYIDKVDGAQEPPEDLQNITGTSVEIELDENETYFWRIKSSDGQNSSYSPVHYFKT